MIACQLCYVIGESTYVIADLEFWMFFSFSDRVDMCADCFMVFGWNDCVFCVLSY